MAATWTTTELLAAIREIGRLSEDDPDATAANLLLEADRQMDRVFVPFVRKARGDYFLTWEDQDLVSEQAEYRIPWRATGAVVRSVWLYNPATGEEINELMPVALDRLAGTNGHPHVYAIRDDEVVIGPKPTNTSYDLRIYYERRPSKLVEVSAAGAIDTISSQSSTSLVVPDTTLATVANGDSVDVVCKRPPFSLYISGAAAAVGGGSITIPKGSADRTVSAGDYLCEAGETPIPNLPSELHPLLATATASAWLRPIDRGSSDQLQEDLRVGLEEIRTLITPRQIGRQQKLKSTNSLMRRGSTRRGNTFDDWS